MDLLIPDELTRFIAQVVVIVAVSRVVGLGTRWIRQPMVIAEITAGILLGPSLLGWLFPDVSASLFTAGSMGILKMVSQFGLVLFMFIIGLELDPQLLRGRGHTSVAISHTSIVLPFVLGVLLAIYLHPRYSDESVPFLAFALFLGAAMSITAFPVLARILSERRLLRTRVGSVTITCAAVDDVTAWCILAFVVAVARSTGLLNAVYTTLVALAYIAAMIWLVRPLLVRMAARVANRESMSQNLLAVVLVMLLASSWISELIGIHALFGAFLFGAILPKGQGFAHALLEKLEDLVLVALLPLFFAYSGLRTQIGLLDTSEAWLVCGLIIAVACAGKFGGSAVAARLTGLSWREANALGILMNTRGLMELIVLNIGLDLGVISPLIFSMMVLMALFTTFITTPLLERIYPVEELSRELVDLVGVDQAAQPAAPAAMGGFTVLMCVADERSGPGLVNLARAFGGDARDRQAQLYALQLVAPSSRVSPHTSDVEQRAATTLAPLLERARSLDVQVRAISFVSPEPARDICNVAEVRGADLILLGWHKPVLSQTMLGGVVHDVLDHAPTTVGVFADRGLTQVRRILVPFQGSAHDRGALALAQRLLISRNAEVTILHVVPPERSDDEQELGARAMAQHVFGEPTGGQVRVEIVKHAFPADAALEESARGYDLVIVGLGREWGLEQRQFGVHPERLMRDCSTSLLVVRHQPRQLARAQLAGDLAGELSRDLVRDAGKRDA
jgi:Kef-type K+ transport system membrane component KefB/nucleotide-binding universal stress UspA family protein